jgi:hypothetical protein
MLTTILPDFGALIVILQASRAIVRLVFEIALRPVRCRPADTLILNQTSSAPWRNSSSLREFDRLSDSPDGHKNSCVRASRDWRGYYRGGNPGCFRDEARGLGRVALLVQIQPCRFEFLPESEKSLCYLQMTQNATIP